MKKIKMSELGNTLPIGLVKGGKLIKDVAFRTWTMVQERVIGEKRKENINQGQLVSIILCEMITRMFGADFNSKPESHRLLDLNQMWMADVLYAYLALRKEALGPELDLKITCGNCRSTFDFKADLNSMGVTVKEKEDELQQHVDLVGGFTFGDAVRKGVTIAPAKWLAMEGLRPDVARNPSEMEWVLFSSSIIAIDGVESAGPLAFTTSSFDDMSKRDINKLRDAIVENNAGPEMAVEGKCPNCLVPFINPIRWEYDSFFS